MESFSSFLFVVVSNCSASVVDATVRTRNWYFRTSDYFTEVLSCLCQPIYCEKGFCRVCSSA